MEEAIKHELLRRSIEVSTHTISQLHNKLGKEDAVKDSWALLKVSVEKLTKEIKSL